MLGQASTASRAGRLRRALAAAAAASFVLLSALDAAPAAAVPGAPTQVPAPNACFAGLAIGGCAAAPLSGFNGPLGVDVAPDGNDVYVANQLSGIGHFRRAAASGVLTPAGGAAVSGDFELRDVYVLPGGSLALAASGNTSGEGRIEVFARNADTGALATLACADQDGGGGCTDVSGIGGAREIAVAPSGPGVYVASAYAGAEDQGAATVFTLNTATGTLNQLRCIAVVDLGSGPCAVQDGNEHVLVRAAAVAASPDGRHVYFGGSGGLVGYNRDQTSGDLVSEASCFRRPIDEPLCPREEGLPVIERIAISPDGEYLYAGGDTGLAVFDRNPVSGTLAFVECFKRAGAAGPCPVLDDFAGAKGVGIAPNGATLYTAGGVFGEGILKAFRVDAGSGRLSPISCVTFAPTGACASGAGLLQPTALAVADDGLGLYVASYEGTGTGDKGALAAFQIEQPPPVPVADASPADRTVSLRILGKRLRINGRGVGRLRLRCPAAEKSPPCAGRVRLRTRLRVEIAKAPASKRRVVTLASARFRIGAGKTQAVKLRLGRAKLRLVRSDPRARKAVAIAAVRDGAGNGSNVRRNLLVAVKRPR